MYAIKLFLAPALAIFSPQQLGAVAGGVLLTLWFILKTVNTAMHRFHRDRNYAQFFLLLGGTLLIGFAIVQTTYKIVDKVVETTRSLNATTSKL